MTVWSMVPISSLYEGLYDGPHATPKPAAEGPVFLGIKNVTDDGHLDLSEIRHIAEDDYPTWTRRVEPRAGDIVFTYEATLNRYAIIPPGFRGCLGRRMALIRPDSARVETRYLYYYFFSKAWREVVRQHTLSGSTVDRLPLTKFPEFPVAIPPLPQQRRIADSLSAYDDLIDNCERRIGLLDEMARALYREWFVNFRYPGREKVPLVGSSLGRIPKGWGIGRLDDILVLQRGFDLPKSARREGTVPIIAATGIGGSHDMPKVRAPGVVTGRSGSIGTVLYVQEDFWPLNTTLWVKEFPNSEPLYAYYVLSSIDLRKFDGGAAVPTLNRNALHGLPAVVPPRELQRRFQAIAGTMHEMMHVLQRRLATLRLSRDLLLPRLLSGQLDLGDAA